MQLLNATLKLAQKGKKKHLCINEKQETKKRLESNLQRHYIISGRIVKEVHFLGFYVVQYDQIHKTT